MYTTKKVWRYAVVFLMVLALLLAAMPVVGAQGAEFKLTVLHTNDVHAHYLPFDAGGGACDPAKGCWGGVARTATVVNKVRGEGGNVVLLDAGDQFQGTLFYNQYKGEAAMNFMNAIGYQAMTVGNHEFDDGPGPLGKFVKGINFPLLSANLDVSAEPELAGQIKPWTVIEVGGQKVGVFGLTTEELPSIASPGPNVKVKSAVDSAKEAVAALKGQGVNKIIALTHIGYGADKALAAAVDDIDLIVGGHTHTYLSSTDETAEGPYPTLAKSPNGSTVLIVTDGAWAKNLGRLDVTFDANGVATAWQGEPIPLGDDVAPDPTLEAKASEMSKPLEELQKTVIGQAAVDLVGDKAVCRFEECNMGNLIADAMLWKTQAEGTQIAFQNGGGIRASIPAGNVTVGDVLTVLPFGNAIATFELKGADVLTALENGVSRAENPENEGTGRFAQVAGLRYTWDPTKPAGSRIVSVEVGTAATGYKPLDPNATYKLAANNFNRTGGDDYTVFAEKAINPYDAGALLADSVMEYIKLNSPVSPALEGRISKGEGAPAPEALPPTGGAIPVESLLFLGSALTLLGGAGYALARRRLS
jgi:5'-nucleotidase/UDP-sugar diphosphatase